jgi:peptidoglycan/LPS O-acetylase OafA/YrhL
MRWGHFLSFAVGDDAALRSPPARRRIRAIDGLRGWAAVMVVCFHFLWELLGKRFPMYRSPVLAWFLNGEFAVAVFFVVSGIALTSGFFATGDRRALIALAVKRHSRLTVPLGIACAMVYGLYQAGLTFCGPVGIVMHRTDWIGSWLSQPVDLGRWLSYSLYGVFITRNDAAAVDPFLWTMRVELWSSFALFGLMLVLPRSRWSWAVLALSCSVLLLRSDLHYFACFVAGAAFAMFRHHGGLVLTGRTPAVQIATSATIFIGLYLSGILNISNRFIAVRDLLSIAVALSLITNQWASKFLESGPSQFLGRISFNLYLVQFPILISASAFGLVWLETRGSLTVVTASGVAFASIAACITAAALMRPVDGLTRQVGEAIYRLYDKLAAGFHTAQHAPYSQDRPGSPIKIGLQSPVHAGLNPAEALPAPAEYPDSPPPPVAM